MSESMKGYVVHGHVEDKICGRQQNGLTCVRPKWHDQIGEHCFAVELRQGDFWGVYMNNDLRWNKLLETWPSDVLNPVSYEIDRRGAVTHTKAKLERLST